MSQITTEIIPEVNKIYKTCFTFAIPNFKRKLNITSCLDINIPGLTTCHLEVHPNQRNFNSSLTSSLKSTKLVFRMDPPTLRANKQRSVKLEVKTLIDLTCYWIDEFPYNNGAIERTKEEFMNQLYLNSCYLQEECLILKGIVTVKEMDWQEASVSFETGDMRHQKLIRDIHSLVTSGNLSDFTFVVQERRMEVHKAILAARSPVFERMFTGNFAEATAKTQVIKDIAADVFEEFLYFLYTGDFRNEEMPVEDLLSVADRYEVTDLMRLCEAELLKSISDDNAEAVYRIANRIQCNPELKQVSFQVLQSMFEHFAVSLPNEFISAPEKVFRSIEMKKQLENAVSIASSEPSADDAVFSNQSNNANNVRSAEVASPDSSFYGLPASILNEDSSRISSVSESDISISLGDILANIRSDGESSEEAEEAEVSNI